MVEGRPNCLFGLTFVFTGAKGSFSATEDLCRKYGARVTKTVSSKTSFLVKTKFPDGRHIAQANKLRTPIIEENEVHDMIRTRPEHKLSTKQKKKEVTTKKQSRALALPFLLQQPAPQTDDKTLPWSERFRPKTHTQLLGNQTNVKHLVDFLRTWQTNAFKAVMLFGPPGVGKTTAAHVLSKELGFEPLECNASSTRTQKTIDHLLGEASASRGIRECFAAQEKMGVHRATVLVVDEVDGMAGNEDRGGIQSLVKLIKSAKVPVICIANDGKKKQLDTLNKSCLQLSWQKPSAAEIATHLRAICKQEGLTMDQPTMEKLVLGANCDIRAVLNMCQMLSRTRTSLSFEEASAELKVGSKDQSAQAFHVVKDLFSRYVGNPTDTKARAKWLEEQMDVYFVDPMLVPLYVHENYHSARILCQPSSREEVARLGEVQTKLVYVQEGLSKAADAISQGDVVDRQKMTTANWTLAPVHAVFSCVLPGFHTGAGVTFPFPKFPAWLGNNSAMNKRMRECVALRTANGCEMTCSTKEFVCDYAPFLKQHHPERLAFVQKGTFRKRKGRGGSTKEEEAAEEEDGEEEEDVRLERE